MKIKLSCKSAVVLTAWNKVQLKQSQFTYTSKTGSQNYVCIWEKQDLRLYYKNLNHRPRFDVEWYSANKDFSPFNFSGSQLHYVKMGQRVLSLDNNMWKTLEVLGRFFCVLKYYYLYKKSLKLPLTNMKSASEYFSAWKKYFYRRNTFRIF